MIELGAMKRESIADLCKDSRISLVRAAAEGKVRAFQRSTVLRFVWF